MGVFTVTEGQGELEKKSAGFLRVIESRRDEIGEGFRIGNLRSERHCPLPINNITGGFL
jgi:hypothetical protein